MDKIDKLVRKIPVKNHFEEDICERCKRKFKFYPRMKRKFKYGNICRNCYMYCCNKDKKERMKKKGICIQCYKKKVRMIKCPHCKKPIIKSIRCSSCIKDNNASILRAKLVSEDGGGK